MQANDQGRAYPIDHLEGNQECVVEGLAIFIRIVFQAWSIALATRLADLVAASVPQLRLSA